MGDSKKPTPLHGLGGFVTTVGEYEALQLRVGEEVVIVAAYKATTGHNRIRVVAAQSVDIKRLNADEVGEIMYLKHRGKA